MYDPTQGTIRFDVEVKDKSGNPALSVPEKGPR